MKVVIKKLDESPFSLRDVYEFIRIVYADRKAEGINFWLSICSFEEYETKVKKDKKIVFVACEETGKALLGTAALTIHKKRKMVYGGMTGCAVKNDLQNMHIGSRLIDELKKKAIEEDCEYLKSTTAVNAISSVRWHLKNGYLKCGLGSGAKSNYYSYIFIMPLKNTNSFYYKFGYKIAYVFSCLKTKSILKENGKLTWFGKLLKKIKKNDFNK